MPIPVTPICISQHQNAHNMRLKLKQCSYGAFNLAAPKDKTTVMQVAIVDSSDKTINGSNGQKAILYIELDTDSSDELRDAFEEGDIEYLISLSSDYADSVISTRDYKGQLIAFCEQYARFYDELELAAKINRVNDLAQEVMEMNKKFNRLANKPNISDPESAIDCIRNKAKLLEKRMSRLRDSIKHNADDTHTMTKQVDRLEDVKLKHKQLHKILESLSNDEVRPD